MIRDILLNIKNRVLNLIRKPKRLVLVIVAALVLVVAGFFLVSSVVSDDLPNTKGVTIERTYETVARTEERQRTDGNFNVKVTNAEFADFILVQGQRANPIEGKVFLVLNMEIENPYQAALYAFPVDFFRLVREDGSKFAPSVHQGTVQVRPEATKKSNVGFVVLPSEKNFKVEIGQVGETKEILDISF